MKKSGICENSDNPTRFLLCWVNFANTNCDHFEVYSYDIMGLFLWHLLILIARNPSKYDYYQ